MTSPSLESALVRILRSEGNQHRPVGAGFLVTPQHLMTCAHVVNCAFGLSKNAAARPDADAEVLLDFPLLTDRPVLRATILHWFPVQGESAVGAVEDIAVLELLPDCLLPDEARPAPLVVPEDQSFFDRRVRLCGFPVGADNGTYANGILQGVTAKGWVEIHHQGRELVEGGFSGTAVWSAEENAALGMTVSILNRQNARVAYMIPAALLIKAFPDLDRHSRPANPYRGLEVFREQDARFYFGRASDADALRETITRQPFTAVIGASGSGKSSLVLAGVIPALRRTGDWLIADCRPKKQPLYELAACLVPLLYDDELELIKRTRQCAADLDAGELSLSDLIRRIVQKSGAQRFLLVIDQFEELYTLNEAGKARSFIDLLLAAGETEVLSAVITLRADFLETALQYNAFAEALKKALFIVPPINEKGLREAVEKPAELLRVAFESGLIDLIIRDVGREPGSLPLLEFCLTQLWERQEFRRITHAAYKGIGGVQQALANHADAVYAEFTEQEQEQLRHIFLRLVRPGQGTEDTRQVAKLEQLRAEDRALVTRLADKRLIVTGRDEERGEETVEVVHEALIRRWRTLRQWVDEEREFLVWQEKLRVLLGQWEENGKDEGALLRGLPLDEALRWRGTHEIHLANGEREFIEASEQLREQRGKEKDRQRRRNITWLVIGLVIAVVLSLFSVVQWRSADKERQHAVEQRGIAEQQTLAANYNLAKAFEEKALTALKAADGQGDVEYKKAVLFASAALKQNIESNKSALKPASIGKLFEPESFKGGLAELALFKGHEDIIWSVVFSPDGTRLASASEDNTIRIWDAASGKELTILKGHEERVWSVAFSPDSARIASVSDDKTVRIWDIASGKEITILRGHENAVRSAVFSPDGSRIVSASDDKTVRIWDIATGKELAVLRGHEKAVPGAAFSPNGTRIVSASEDKTIRIWDAASGRQVGIFKSHELSFVISVAFSPDGNYLALSSEDDVRLWDIASGKQLAVFKGHESFIYKVAFSPDGTRIASASDDKTARVWDIARGKQISIFKSHEPSFVFSIAFSPDGSHLAFGSEDDVGLWDIASGKELTTFRGHERAINSAVFSPDGTRIVSASDDKTVRIWDVTSGKELSVLRGHEKGVNSAAFSPDGTRIVSASDDKNVRLWDAASGKELNVLRGHEKGVNSAVFSPDGSRTASASDDKTVRIWDVTSGKELSVLRGHEKGVNSAAFSPDGSSLASTSYDKTVRMWDIASGKELRVFKSGYVSVAFSFDERKIAEQDFATIRLWSIASGKELTTFRGHEKAVNSAVFSPDGSRIASTSYDKTVRIWDIASGKQLADLKGHENAVTSAAFSPDGKMIVSSSDNTLRIWDLTCYDLFLQNSDKPTPLYHTFIDAVKFLWQLDVQGLEIVETERRTPADLEKYGALLAPPPPGQSKFDQVLEWAEKQQGK